MAKRGADLLDRLAVPIDESVTNDTLGDPTTDVSEQAQRDRDRRLPLLGLDGAVR